MSSGKHVWIEVPVPAYFDELLTREFSGNPDGKAQLLSLFVAIGMMLCETGAAVPPEPGHVIFRKKKLPKELFLEIVHPH